MNWAGRSGIGRQSIGREGAELRACLADGVGGRAPVLLFPRHEGLALGAHLLQNLGVDAVQLQRVAVDPDGAVRQQPEHAPHALKVRLPCEVRIGGGGFTLIRPFLQDTGIANPRQYRHYMPAPNALFISRRFLTLLPHSFVYLSITHISIHLTLTHAPTRRYLLMLVGLMVVPDQKWQQQQLLQRSAIV